MKALTLIQPWAWCITHLDKRVENRTWAPPAVMLGQRFAIHAGKKTPDVDAWAQIAKACRYELPRAAEAAPNMHVGAVVATAELVGTVTGPVSRWTEACTPRLAALVGARGGIWCLGPVGWVLDDVRVLSEPVPCRGAQGLWTLPYDVERLVLEREGTTR